MASFGGEAGDSMTSLLNPGGAQGMDVLTIAWADFAAAVDLSGVALVKMDIEGAEFDVLPALLPWLQAVRPALYLSTHAPFLPPETRASRMAALAQALDFYAECRDERGAVIGAGALSAADSLDRFRSFLFSG